MAEYLNLYRNNPTEGAKDGTIVSTNGAQTSPLSATLVIGVTESKTQKVALRTEENYSTAGDTIIKFEGTTADKWSASLTESGTFLATLTVADEIIDENKIFYVKAEANSDETVANDKSVSIVVEANIIAVD